MAVEVTDSLAKRFQDAGLELQPFIDEFAAWKAGWPKNEDEFELFGKDGMYDQPHINGARVLWHVHLEPVEDRQAARDWLRAFRFRRRRTSDRALIYARRGRNDYLLITILDEPDAHAIARMRTRQHRELMEAFAEVAEAWIVDGDIIA